MSGPTSVMDTMILQQQLRSGNVVVQANATATVELNGFLVEVFAIAFLAKWQYESHDQITQRTGGVFHCCEDGRGWANSEDGVLQDVELDDCIDVLELDVCIHGCLGLQNTTGAGHQ